MLKFFRRIRQKLLNKGNLRKYLFYVAGEIILVVIGILIALQINIWNESRKSNQELNEIFKTIAAEIEQDRPKIQRYLGHLNWKSSIIDSTVLDQIPLERLYQCYSCLTSHTWVRNLAISQKGYNNLLSFYTRNNSSTDNLIAEVIDVYQFFNDQVARSIKTIYNDALENAYYGQNEADYINAEEWYQLTNTQTMTKDLAMKILGDQQNKKRMIRHNLLLKLNIRDLKQFDNRLTKLQKMMDERVR